MAIKLANCIVSKQLIAVYLPAVGSLFVVGSEIECIDSILLKFMVMTIILDKNCQIFYLPIPSISIEGFVTQGVNPNAAIRFATFRASFFCSGGT